MNFRQKVKKKDVNRVNPVCPTCGTYGWASDDFRIDIRATGIFTYDGDGTLTIVDAFHSQGKNDGANLAGRFG